MALRPNTIVILDTEKMITDFLKHTGNAVGQQDLEEIITQILMIFLNFGTSETTGIINSDDFPDMERLILYRQIQDISGRQSAEFCKILRHATQELAEKLRETIVHLDLYEDNVLPYYFSHFLGRDLVIRHLPY